MNFFEALRKKIEIQPDKNFDKNFWREFDSEFGRPKFIFWKPIFAGLALIFIGFLTFSTLKPQLFSVKDEVASEMVEVISHKEMMAELPMLKAFDRLPTSDEDWEILLADNGRAEK